MLHSGQDLPLRRSIAGPLVSNDDPRDIAAALEQLAEEALGGLLITLSSDQDIQHVAMLVHGAPQVTGLTVDLDEDFIQVLFISRLRPTSAQLIGIGLPKLAAPLTNSFVNHLDAAGGEEFFDIMVAERETEIKP